MGDLDAPLIGSCGKLLSCMEARLVDPDEGDVSIGQAGELWLRGPVRTPSSGSDLLIIYIFCSFLVSHWVKNRIS